MQLKEVPILILVANFKNPILPIALFPTPSHSLHQLLASTFGISFGYVALNSITTKVHFSP